MIAGADGCGKGWLVLMEEERGGAVSMARTLDLGKILDRHPELEVLAVDIPIGVPRAGSRRCDDEARRFLGRRGSCVFPTPVRATFEAADYAQALDMHRQADMRGLSKQAYAILPRIKQVDELVRTHARGEVVREVHPEVSFAAMSGGRALQRSKHTLEGLTVRLALVNAEFGEGAFGAVREQLLPSQAHDHDILDAFAALWTARRIADDTAERFPADPAEDPLGVPMHINY